MTPLRTIQTAPAKANDLFSRIADTTPGAVKTRETLFADLKTELELIASLERDHLLPVLKKHAGTKAMAPKITERLKDMADALRRLDAAPKEGTEFPGQVNELKKLFQAHLRDEKNELLPAIKKALSDEEVQAVADKVAAQKAEVEQAEREADEARRAKARLAREQEEARQDAIDAAKREADKVRRAEARLAREQEEARQAAVDAAERAQKKAAAEAARAVKAAAEATQKQVQEAEAVLRSNIDAVTDSTQRTMAAAQAAPILAESFQSASREWMGWFQGRMQRRAQGVSALMSCRNPADFMQTQSRLVREEFEEMLQTTSRVSEIAASAASKAARTVSA